MPYILEQYVPHDTCLTFMYHNVSSQTRHGWRFNFFIFGEVSGTNKKSLWSVSLNYSCLTTSIYYGGYNERIFTSVPPICLHSLHKDNFISIPAPKKKE